MCVPGPQKLDQLRKRAASTHARLRYPRALPRSFWRAGIPILLALVLLDGHELVTEALPLEFCISLS